MESGSSDTLGIVAIVISGVSAFAAIASVALTAVWRRQDRAETARREAWERDEAARRAEWERSQAARREAAERPELVVIWESHTSADAPGEIAVYLRLVNKGPTVARRIQVGLRYGSVLMLAESVDPALRDPRTIPALGPDERYDSDLVVNVSMGVMQSLRAKQERAEDVLHPFARFQDKRGNVHETS